MAMTEEEFWERSELRLSELKKLTANDEDEEEDEKFREALKCTQNAIDHRDARDFARTMDLVLSLIVKHCEKCGCETCQETLRSIKEG